LEFYLSDSSKKLKVDLSFILKNISIFNTDIPSNHLPENIFLSHNGIRIPNESKFFGGSGLELNISTTQKFKTNFSIGLLELKDDLRPELNLARNLITHISWNLFSQLNYSIVKSFEEVEKPSFIPEFVYLKNVDLKETLYKDLLKDKLIFDKNFWAKENLFDCDGESFSINNLSESNLEHKINLYPPYINFSIYSQNLLFALLQKHCFLKIRLSSSQ
jgi:hypothetical protein